MTGGPDNQARFDRAVRACHADAVAHLSPRTIARLRPRAGQAAHRHALRAPPLGWSLATACAAVFVFAIGMQALAPPDGGAEDAATPVARTEPVVVRPPRPDLYDDPLLAFEEDPDLFLWLASSGTQPLAME